MSGCGVGFKLVQAYASRHGIPFEQYQTLLDLLVVSIASDLVSVTGENRVLAYYGLKQLNENPRKGLIPIIKLSGLEKHRITIDEIVFLSKAIQHSFQQRDIPCWSSKVVAFEHIHVLGCRANHGHFPSKIFI